MPFLKSTLLLGFLALHNSVIASIIHFNSTGNPILADGSYYSADPGPIVVNNTLYIITGHDTAPPGVDNFIMPNWLLWSTDSVRKPSTWTLDTNFLRPHKLFEWAAPGMAYASQIVQGVDGRFYVYCPVGQANYTTQDPFGIGVGVSDHVTGPYKDAHPSGPIVSESVPAPGNDIQNIDPTTFIDDDGSVYMYWGTFGQLRGAQLASDMITVASDIISVTSLDGYFEAPWLMKRKDTYYLLYADNSVGDASMCTPTLYHACIAYGTASSPLGPWTYRGVILGIVSSTTSHPGAFNLNGYWHLVYHTADAAGGGTFRRSIAIDNMHWNDSTTPPSILPVKQTHRPGPPPLPTRNRAQLATVVTDPVPEIWYWTAALNDLKVVENPLPPDYWSDWRGEDMPLISTLTYTWKHSVQLNGTAMVFFADHPAGATEGVAPPTDWYVEYLTSNGSWLRVVNTTTYPLEVTRHPREVGFNTVRTTGLRAILAGSTDGVNTAAVGVEEWYALSPNVKVV